MWFRTARAYRKVRPSEYICVIRHGYYPEDPRVYKEVRALYEAGYSVDVICLGGSTDKRKEIIDGVHVYRLSHRHKRGYLLRYFYEYGLSFMEMFVLLTVLFFRRRYDIIQVNTLPDALVFVSIVPRLFGAKVLLDMHEPTPELFSSTYGPNKYRLVYRFLTLMEKLSIKYASQVLTVNEVLRRRLIARGALGRKIHVVRNVPHESFGANLCAQSSGKRLRLLTHGTILKRYGQQVLIRAVSLLRDMGKETQLFIVGDGENGKEVRSLADRLGCSDVVIFTGRVPFSEIGQFINKADICVVPLLASAFSELCQPNKLFEYAACRKPIIVSRLRAVEETFDASCVMFFEPGDHQDLARCIAELYEYPEKRRELAENAYRQYEKIRWEETKKIYLKVVHALVAQRKRE